MKGVVLLAHGTPASLDEMPEYLTRVRGGRAPSPELVLEMQRNYAAIGGRSPLTDITRAQAEALSTETGLPVFFAMRTWDPLIADVLPGILAQGVRELVAIPMAPQFSSLSVGKYREAVEQAAPPGLAIRFVEPWHDHPLLLVAFASKVEAARKAEPPDVVVFTAHSLPERVVREGDPYARHVAATARGVAALCGLPEYLQAYQSAGRTPEPWLGPTLEACLDSLAGRAKRVLVVPVGFVCDHTEILFDIDIQARRHGEGLGIEVLRTASLNTDPLLIRALASLAS
jgi:ferrochelatase